MTKCLNIFLSTLNRNRHFINIKGDLHIPSNFKGDLTAAVRISKNKGARMFLKEIK